MRAEEPQKVPVTETSAPAVTSTIDPGSLFRFATAGSVDDGKSTLVGRLLHDAKAILADQLEAVGKRGYGHASYSLVPGVDGEPTVGVKHRLVDDSPGGIRKVLCRRDLACYPG